MAMISHSDKSWRRVYRNRIQNLRLKHGIQDYLEWKRTMKSLPFSIFKVTELNFLWHQYGIALENCANFETPKFKGLACAGLQRFDLKCPPEAFGGMIQCFYWSQKSFILKSCILGGARFVKIVLSSTLNYRILQFLKSSKTQLVLFFAIYVLPTGPANQLSLTIF